MNEGTDNGFDDEMLATAQNQVIQQTSKEVLLKLENTYQVDEWIALRFGNTWFPAQVVEVT